MPSRRKAEGVSRVRAIRFTDDEWDRVRELALIYGETVAQYVRAQSLAGSQRS